MATALSSLLETVVPASRPWMSSNGISPGQRWVQEIGSQLSNTHFGIICVTPENQKAPWLNFEAGALGKSLAEGVVVPYLFDMAPSDLWSGPLTQFQALQSTSDDTERLVGDINSRSERPLAPGVLMTLFRRGWPEFQTQLAQIQLPDAETPEPGRDDAAKIDELLELVRQLARSSKAPQSPKPLPNQLVSWHVVRSRAAPQLKAFLMPAEVFVSSESKRVIVHYKEAHLFHEAQIRKRLPQLQDLIRHEYGSDYSVEIVGPRGVEKADETSTDWGPFPAEETLLPEEPFPAEEDLPF